MAQRLAAGVRAVDGVEILYEVQANAVFARLPHEVSERLQKRFRFYFWDEAAGDVRWMCAYEHHGGRCGRVRPGAEGGDGALGGALVLCGTGRGPSLGLGFPLPSAPLGSGAAPPPGAGRAGKGAARPIRARPGTGPCPHLGCQVRAAPGPSGRLPGPGRCGPAPLGQGVPSPAPSPKPAGQWDRFRADEWVAGRAVPRAPEGARKRAARTGRVARAAGPQIQCSPVPLKGRPRQPVASRSCAGVGAVPPRWAGIHQVSFSSFGRTG
ncbi:hypothetical protein SSPIM334S_08036 [Streptomyces spiroverticillatus]